MALVSAKFIINDITDEEKFVETLPADYIFQPGERLVTRQIPEEEFALLKDNFGQRLKIYRYVDNSSLFDKFEPPFGLNYKTGLTVRLHPKHEVAPNGYLQQSKYYSNISYNPTIGEWEYDDLVVCAVFDYVVDPVTEFTVSRTKEVRYFKENGEMHPDTKQMFKVYSVLEMDEVAIKRRSNVISLIKIEISKFVAWLFSVQFPDPNTRPNSNDAAKQIMQPLNMPILNYINGGDRSIIDIIRYAKEPFFDTMMPSKGKTVRNFIVDRMEEHA